MARHVRTLLMPNFPLPASPLPAPLGLHVSRVAVSLDARNTAACCCCVAWLFGDSNTVVSSRWGLGGVRHFSGALRPFRHSSRGLPSGSAIWCPSSLRCAEAHYSGFVGRASSMWLLGEYGIFLFCSPRFWFVGVFFVRAFLLGRLVIILSTPRAFRSTGLNLE